MTLAALRTPHIDWFALATILALLGASGIALLGAVLVPRRWRRTFAGSVSALGFAGGIVAAVWLYVDSRHGERVIANAFYRDRWTALAQVILCAVGLATSLMAVEHVPGWRRDSDPTRRDDHIAEFFALLLASGAGMAFFVGAANLMTLFLSLEWLSIALYVMCAIDYDLPDGSVAGQAADARREDWVAFGGPGGSLEAGLKYFVVGSFGSASLLFGSALVYGATGRIDFVGIDHAIAA
ncbi:MAG TPA: proton-conducting transporter membrane subunit, partial [Gaiellaceae bacterium]|nr:proton-conducting transporter membrane subunit [Gaiellaceae bacterium]